MDEDYDDDFESTEEEFESSVLPIPSRQLEIRRAIEDHLAQRQMEEELGLY